LVEWRVIADVTKDIEIQSSAPEIEIVNPEEWENLTGPGPGWTNYVYLQNLQLGISSFYLQDFTDLDPSFQLLGIRPGRHVRKESEAFGMAWPKAKEILGAGNRVVLSHAFLYLSTRCSNSDEGKLRDFMHLLAPIYVRMIRPETVYTDWLEVARREVTDLLRPECLTDPVLGHRHMRAYVNHFDFQYTDLHCDLEILVPVSQLNQWTPTPETEKLKSLLNDGLLTYLDEANRRFYNNVVPASFADKKRPIWGIDQVDTWYEANNFYMLGRLAEQGNESAKRMIFSAVDEWIELAKGVDYDFPLFADYLTKKGTFSNAYNVCGAYAYNMLQCYRLSGGEERYLDEAKKACGRIDRYGFERRHEIHMSAAGVAACAWLYEITSDPAYLDLLEAPLAEVLRSAYLSETDFGYARYYQNFFGLGFSMGASQVAAQESAAVWDLIREAYLRVGDRLSQDARMWMAEIHKRQMGVLRFMIPPLVNPRAVHPGPVSWPVDLRLSISLEDMRDGSVPLGTMGQGIYMARGALQFAASAYRSIGPGLTLFCEYPVMEAQGSQESGIDLRIGGTSGFYALTELRWLPGAWETDQGPFVYLIDSAQRSYPISLQSEKGGMTWKAEGGSTYRILASPMVASPTSEWTSLNSGFEAFPQSSLGDFAEPRPIIHIDPWSELHFAPGISRSMSISVEEIPEAELAKDLRWTLPSGWKAEISAASDGSRLNLEIEPPLKAELGTYPGKVWFVQKDTEIPMGSRGVTLRIVQPSEGYCEEFDPNEAFMRLKRKVCVDLDRFPYLFVRVPRIGKGYGWTLFAGDSSKRIRVEQDTWRAGDFCWDLRKSLDWTGPHEFEIELNAMLHSTAYVESISILAEPPCLSQMKELRREE